MKITRKKYLSAAAAGLAILVGCGGDAVTAVGSGSTTSTGGSSTKTVASLDDLPACKGRVVGKVYHVESENVDLTCTEYGWEMGGVASGEQSSSSSKSASSAADGRVCEPGDNKIEDGGSYYEYYLCNDDGSEMVFSHTMPKYDFSSSSFYYPTIDLDKPCIKEDGSIALQGESWLRPSSYYMGSMEICYCETLGIANCSWMGSETPSPYPSSSSMYVSPFPFPSSSSTYVPPFPLFPSSSSYALVIPTMPSSSSVAVVNPSGIPCGDLFCGPSGYSNVATGFGSEYEGYWFDYDDSGDRGSSYIIWPAPKDDLYAYDYILNQTDAISGTYSLDVGANKYDPFVAVAFTLDADGFTYDLTSWKGLCVVYKSDMPIQLQIGLDDYEEKLLEYDVPAAVLPKSASIKMQQFTWSSFTQKWTVPATMTGTSAAKEVKQFKFQFKGSDGDSGNFAIYSVGRYGSCS